MTIIARKAMTLNTGIRLNHAMICPSLSPKRMIIVRVLKPSVGQGEVRGVKERGERRSAREGVRIL